MDGFQREKTIFVNKREISTFHYPPLCSNSALLNCVFLKLNPMVKNNLKTLEKYELKIKKNSPFLGYNTPSNCPF
jgi:hypothetical protein